MKNISETGIKLESPAHKAALLIVIGIALSATFIYFLIMPLKSRIAACVKNSSDTTTTNDRIRAVIRTTNSKKQSVAHLQKEYGALHDKGVLIPLLNSYAMRAKTLVKPCALQSGVTIENVRELPPIPLQQPQPLNAAAYCRQPIEFTASGSYTQLTAFISSVENKLPMCILSSLKISNQSRFPEIHKIQICFEWPTKTGPVVAP